MLEMKTVLRTLLQRFRLAPAERADEGIGRITIQFKPKRGARVALTERLPPA